ncbi:hypothetical protein ADILRU_1687 [Leifsonia rubra CMS 76R]|nr:hypothetical protein ADILRU_1687 [Leifsonia rubra CMS 76R]
MRELDVHNGTDYTRDTTNTGNSCCRRVSWRLFGGRFFGGRFLAGALLAGAFSVMASLSMVLT